MPKVSEEHRASRREQIIDAMLRCVARDGFHKTTMASVIAESGLSAGAVYLYFRSKAELIRAIAEMVAGAGLAVVVDDDSGEVRPPHEVLVAVLERILAVGQERGVELDRVALQAWAEAAHDPEIRTIIQAGSDRGHATWATYAERAIAAGHLPSDADPVHAARALTGLIPGFVVQRLVFEDLTPASYAAAVFELATRPASGSG